MSQMLRTTRRLPLETVTYEPFAGMDGQGKPSYGTPVSVQANVLEYDAALFSRGAEFVITKDGSKIMTPLTLYVRGTATTVPAEQGRVTLAGNRRFVVRERKPVSGLRRTRAEPDHYRLRCSVT